MQHTITSVTLCHECAYGVANDDWTHLDYHHDQEDADRALALVTANMELLGWLTLVGDADMSGYFDCALCWEIQCGGGHRFDAERDGLS